MFLSRLRDVIANSPINVNGQSTVQSRNLASGLYRRLEASIGTSLARTLDVGGNSRRPSGRCPPPNVPNMKAVGTPNHKLFLYADWCPTEQLSIVPSVEAASDRYNQNASGTVFFGNSGYVFTNLQASYALTVNAELSTGAGNLFDATYSLADGFPDPRRPLHVIYIYEYIDGSWFDKRQ